MVWDGRSGSGAKELGLKYQEKLLKIQSGVQLASMLCCEAIGWELSGNKSGASTATGFRA